MYRHIIHVTVLPMKPGLDELFLADLVRIVEDSRLFSGCFSFDLYRLTNEPNAIVLHEIWETQEAYQAHSHSPLRGELTRITAAALARPIQTWQVEEIC